MQRPLQITFRDLAPSDAVEDRIQKYADKLNRFHSQILSCWVRVEAPHRHHHKGNSYQVSIGITVPQKELIVKSSSTEHTNLYLTLREAFDAAKRQLTALSDQQHVYRYSNR